MTTWGVAPSGAAPSRGVGPSGGRKPIAAIDTAGKRALVALGDSSGVLLGEERWEAGYRHGEELLRRLDGLLARLAVPLTDLGGIVVGTGPGAFTGLRVGLATAKALASGLALPLAGVPTSTALLNAARVSAPAGRSLALLLPAGPSDRVVVEDGEAPRLVRGGDDADIAGNAVSIAVDLDGRADAEAIERGSRADERLGEWLLRLGAEKLAAGGDDIGLLVPEYVSLPRGIAAVAGEVQWSRDRG